MTSRARTKRLSAMTFTATVLLLWLALRFPGHPDDFAVAHFLRWPLELPLILGILVFWPERRSTAWLRAPLVIFLSVLLMLRLADIGSRLAFGRAFSPLTELHLIGQGWALASQTIGKLEALSIVAGTLLAISVVAYLLFRGLGSLERYTPSARQRIGAVATVLFLAGALLATRHDENSPGRLVTLDVTTELMNRLDAASRSIVDQAEFARALSQDPLSDRPAPRFAALQGLDVIILFVESYGRSYIDDDYYGERARDGLETMQAQLRESGLFARSAWVDSPVKGGRSWLPQATIASGLRLTNHARFDRLISSERVPLHALFRQAGWTSAAVLPIVSGEWVEGAWYDVDRFYNGPDLQYQGKDFGYVSMPDQFTLHRFQTAIRETADRPLMAHIGLLGSHAPWTPLALPVPWDDVGDGRIFDGSHREGRPLDWSNPEPVREAYARSVDMTLQRIGEYLQRHGEDALVMIIGDHQPAGVIAGYRSNSHVPVHVIAANQDILERLPALNFTSGMTPASSAPPIPMEALRLMFATRFERPLGNLESAMRTHCLAVSATAVASQPVSEETDPLSQTCP